MGLKQAGVLSYPHIDQDYFAFFVFQFIVLTLRLIGVTVSHGEFDVCTIPMPLMYLHYDNMRLWLQV